MIWRRRKREGFVWEKHVKTAVLQRRAARAERLEELGVVVQKGAEAGRAGARRSASSVAGAIQSGAARTKTAATATFAHLGSALSRCAMAAGTAFKQVVSRSRQPGSKMPARPHGAHPTGNARSPGLATVQHHLAAAGGAVGAAARSVARAMPFRRSQHGHLPKTRAGVAALLIAPIVFGGLTVAVTSVASLPSSAGLNAVQTLFSTSRDLHGRARVVSGDTIEIRGERIRLADADAPELSQRCRNSAGRSWRCGLTARTRLRRLIGRGRLTCRVWSSASEPTPVGRCARGERDLAEQLIARGYAFASDRATSPAKAAEDAARAAKRGLWAGTAERPSVYRDRLWASAKSNAPNGCPVKARIWRGNKQYFMPWTRGYARVRIHANRGGQWLCSEQQAIADGWRPA